MRGLYYILFIFLPFFARAEVRTGYQIIESDMGLSECLNFSKKARESFIKDDFGELIDDSTYTYISENLEVTVLCLTKKKTIVVFVAAQDADIVDVAGIFVEQLTAKVSK